MESFVIFKDLAIIVVFAKLSKKNEKTEKILKFEV